MLRFFDTVTSTLYNVRPNTNGRGAPGQLSNNPLTLLPNQNGQLLIPILRRQNQGNNGRYVSLRTGQEFFGSYDLYHISNADLRRVANVQNIQ